jgi:hypothetical protein
LFDTANQTAKNCTGQTDAVPFYVFENTGNVDIDLVWFMNETVTDTLDLLFDSDSNPTGATVLPDPPSNSTVVSSLVSAATADVWVWGNVTTGFAGTYNYSLNTTSSES